MANRSHRGYRGSVGGRFAIISIAFSIIFLWITVAGNEYENDRVVVKSDLEISSADEEEDRVVIKSGLLIDMLHGTNSADQFSSDDPSTNLDKPTVVCGECPEDVKSVELWQSAVENSLSWDKSQKMVIDLLTRCTRQDRCTISREYRYSYKEDLAANIKGFIPNWSDDDEAVTLAQMSESTSEILAAALHDATKDERSLNYEALRLILTPLSDRSEIEEMLSIYKKRFQKEPRDILSKATKDHESLEKILRNQLTGRADGEETDENEGLVKDAEKIRTLLMSQDSKAFDQSDFVRIFLTTSYDRLQRVTDQYRLLYGTDATKALKNIAPSKVTEAYVDVVDYAMDSDVYFADKLDAALQADVTDFNTIILIVAWRAEIDLGNIKSAYKQLYEVSLHKAISIVTMEGFLRDVLLGIIGSED